MQAERKDRGDHRSTKMEEIINFDGMGKKDIRDELNTLLNAKLHALAKRRGVKWRKSRQSIIEAIVETFFPKEPVEKWKTQEGDTSGKKKLEKKIEQVEGMKLEELKDEAKKQALTCSGSREELLQIIKSKILGLKHKTEDQIFFKKVIQSWTANEMREYLSHLKSPNWGTKTVMTQRILTKISTDQAVEIANQYRASIKEENKMKEDIREEEGKTQEDRNGEQGGDIEGPKRKRAEKENNQEEEGRIEEEDVTEDKGSLDFSTDEDIDPENEIAMESEKPRS